MPLLEKLSYLRRREGMTAEEIAQRADVPLSTLNKILSGATQNPALLTMDRIAHVFHVPLRYLIEDDVPADCTLCAFAENQGLINLSEREMELLMRYRMLRPHGQDTVDRLSAQLCQQAPEAQRGGTQKTLLCYIAPAVGRTGVYGDALIYRHLTAALPRHIAEADCAVQVATRCMEPVYESGTVLAIREIPCKHNQLGAFLLRGEGYIRKLYDRQGVRKLVATRIGVPDINVAPEDELQCLGIVLGAIREYRWCK